MSSNLKDPFDDWDLHFPTQFSQTKAIRSKVDPFSARARVSGPFELEIRPHFNSLSDTYILKDARSGEPLASLGSYDVAKRVVELLNLGSYVESRGEILPERKQKPHPDSLEHLLYLLGK